MDPQLGELGDKRADVHMKHPIQNHETPRDVIGSVSPWTRECNDWTKSTSRATLTDSLIGLSRTI